MAFLVKQSGRRFWLIRFRDPVTGKRTQVSTKLLVNERLETRKARDLVASYDARERYAKPLSKKEGFTFWVVDYLKTRYGGLESANTLARYSTAWRNITVYL